VTLLVTSQLERHQSQPAYYLPGTILAASIQKLFFALFQAGLRQLDNQCGDESMQSRFERGRKSTGDATKGILDLLEITG
jgi:hypothetical protein